MNQNLQKDKQSRTDFEQQFLTIYGRKPDGLEWHIWYANPQTPQRIMKTAERRRKEIVKAKNRRKPCGGVLRAEKVGAPLVIIKGISYVPVFMDKASSITLETLVDRRPDYFIHGKKVWAVEWLGALLPYVLCQYMILTEYEMIKIIDNCAMLSDAGKKQFILDAAMDAEYNSKDRAIWTAKQKPTDVTDLKLEIDLHPLRPTYKV